MVGRSSKADAPTLYGDLTLVDAQRAKQGGEALLREIGNDPQKAQALLREMGVVSAQDQGADGHPSP